jgi:hypothetical protein
MCSSCLGPKDFRLSTTAMVGLCNTELAIGIAQVANVKADCTRPCASQQIALYNA